MDMVAGVDHTSLTGETILTDSITLVPGGKGANQAYAAGKLGLMYPCSERSEKTVMENVFYKIWFRISSLEEVEEYFGQVT